MSVASQVITRCLPLEYLQKFLPRLRCPLVYGCCRLIAASGGENTLQGMRLRRLVPRVDGGQALRGMCCQRHLHCMRPLH